MVETVSRGAPDAVEKVRRVLDDGGVVGLPTDTVYGLGARPRDREAMGRLFAAKGRPASVPIAVLVADREQARAITHDVGPRANRWMSEWWPGALTLVCRRRDGIGYAIGEPAGTIGVRCPDDDFIRELTAETGPLAVTSANRHGEDPLASAEEMAEVLGDAVDLVVDGGPLVSQASTVIDVTGEPPTVLRRGSLDPALLGVL